MPVPDSILYLSEQDVQQTLSVRQAVELAEKGIRADAEAQVVGDKFYMPVGDAGFLKPFSGYLQGEDLAFVKTFAFFGANPERYSCPATSSLVLLFDAKTGLPVCIMEAGWVTTLKTGASTAVTASYLARPGAETVTIFGAGSQGRMHLRALTCRFSLARAYIVDVLPQVAQDFASELGPELDLDVIPVALADRERAVRSSQMIITVTTGDEPLVEREWLAPGAFVARLGSYQEIALDVIIRADKVIVDNWHYVQPRIPELGKLEKAGQFDRDDIHAEWPDIVAGRRPGRETSDEVIVYIALGIWGEYAAILPKVYRQARKMGLGHELQTTRET